MYIDLQNKLICIITQKGSSKLNCLFELYKKYLDNLDKKDLLKICKIIDLRKTLCFYTNKINNNSLI